MYRRAVCFGCPRGFMRDGIVRTNEKDARYGRPVFETVFGREACETYYSTYDAKTLDYLGLSLYFEDAGGPTTPNGRKLAAGQDWKPAFTMFDGRWLFAKTRDDKLFARFERVADVPTLESLVFEALPFDPSVRGRVPDEVFERWREFDALYLILKPSPQTSEE